MPNVKLLQKNNQKTFLIRPYFRKYSKHVAIHPKKGGAHTIIILKLAFKDITVLYLQGVHEIEVFLRNGREDVLPLFQLYIKNREQEVSI